MTCVLSKDFACPIWSQWSAIKPCTNLCSRIRQSIKNGVVTGLYKDKELMVESRECIGEHNEFGCIDFAKVNGDKDPMRLENFRQNITECNVNICPGNSLSTCLIYSVLISEQINMDIPDESCSCLYAGMTARKVTKEWNNSWYANIVIA